jgi:hypothetical protein
MSQEWQQRGETCFFGRKFKYLVVELVNPVTQNSDMNRVFFAQQ